ncbi:hypothetical protein SLS54_002844 [Diplodia seriata]
MDIFVRNVPVQTTESALRDFFKPVLEEFSILRFYCTKFRKKPLALLTVTDAAKAKLFLDKFSHTKTAVRRESLLFCNTVLLVSESRNRPNELALKALRQEEEDLWRRARRNTTAAPASKPNGRQTRKFEFSCLQCGTWDCNGPDTAFASQFGHRRPGTVVFGKKALAMIIPTETHSSRIDIPYYSIETISTCPRTNKVAFTLIYAPRIYRTENKTLEQMMSELGLSRRPQNTRARVCALDESHRSVVGTCLVYEITLADPKDTSKVDRLVQTNRGMPPALSLSTSHASTSQTFQRDFQRLTTYLWPGSEYGNLAFSIKFQIERLVRNAYLPPYMVIRLLPAFEYLAHKEGPTATTMAIQMLARQIPIPGPDRDPNSLDDEALYWSLRGYAEDFKVEGSIYDEKSWNTNQCALVHRVMITPAGTYLEGPELEAGNRVLRQYRDYADRFLRVEFTDEDGDYVRFEPRTDMSDIFNTRFQGVLDNVIDIADRSYEFLGFSHSSLRQKTCWFLSPMTGTGLSPHELIKDLGDFSEIRCPAKCAARIGQAFSETTATVTISRETLKAANDVVRNGRTFSDGVGTISPALLHRVSKHYGQARQRKPTCLQIRFAGAKGMVSLDNRLKGEQLILRPSMVKFEGSKTWDIEVCGANFKPLPMYLNRSLVKILEDLGVPAENFLELEDQMIEQIRRITESPINAAIFLETSRIGLCTRLPFLFRALDDLGLSFGGDSFLSRIVEIAVLSQLRDVKYRARIPVEEGVTLYGIMDETGFLEEGEIFCTFERPGEKGKLEQHVLTGNDMLVTRSPAMHPGDVQKVRAVEGLPADSPLRHLSNVVVFSQKGQRDLPSQLSGGDLDGDLYNVIWDDRLIPPTTHAAADYNLMPPMDIGRPVTQTDITQFFVKFMETDQLGRISMIHMQLADRAAAGTLDPACKKLAEMASTAVDFSKTGIPVDMSQCPRYDMIRPDFMATSPHVPVVRKDGVGFVDAAAEHGADDDDDDADAVEALDPDLRSYKYYESDRVLGRLYRAIDEKTIFEDMHRRLRTSTATTTPRAAADDGTTLLSHIWNYILRETALIQWESYMPLAREIREIYESNLLDAMSDFSAHPRHPLSEIEILGGNIIGRSGGSASRRVRERTAEMNKRFERDAAFVVQRIVQGDDGDRDEGLARSVACLGVGIGERSSGGAGGKLESWTYVAAAVCLWQVELFRDRYDPFW